MASQDDARTRPQLSFPMRLTLFVVLVCAVVLAPLVQLHFVAQMDPDTYSDLYSPWIGARAILHRSDPYSPAVTAQIQRAIYGHALQSTDARDPEAFVYPAFIAFPLAPFTHLPWPTVERLFACLAPFVILATGWAWLCFCRPGMADAGWGSLATFGVLALLCASWAAVWGSYQRQPSIFAGAAVAVSLLLFCRGSGVRSSILLGLATVKPQLVVLLAAWMLLAAIRLRRYRFVSGLSLTLGLLVAGAVVLVPDWIPHWIHAALAYTHSAGKISLPTFVLGPKLGLLADAALLAGLCLQLWKLRFAPPASSAFVYSAALILAATTCLIPANPWLIFNNLLLVPAILILLVHRPAQALPRLFQGLAAAAVLLALLVTPLCAALALRFGFSTNLVMPPFLVNYLLPIPVTAALLFLRPIEVRHETQIVKGECC